MIKLKLVRIDTEPKSDNVTIYEGANVSEVFLDKLSGSSLPDDVIYTTKPLSVLFRSDRWFTQTGFEVKYTILQSDSGKT